MEKEVEMVYGKCGSCNYEGPEFRLGGVLAIDSLGNPIRERICPSCGCDHCTCTKGLWGF